jgi:hypothetical protein
VYYRGIDSNAWECRVEDVGDFCFTARFHHRLVFVTRTLQRFVTQGS